MTIERWLMLWMYGWTVILLLDVIELREDWKMILLVLFWPVAFPFGFLYDHFIRKQL